MLDPDDRRLYTDALRPPPGFRFSEAVATTYSLSLDTLLTIPLHLALFSAEQPLEELLRDGVTLLEALRRTTDHVTVYGQAGYVHAPPRPHVLYGLLEPTVVEVTPPSESGIFHPKLWLIRFDSPASSSTRLRLLVLTRNITGSRCWDLALTLEGEPGHGEIEDNRELWQLLHRLPGLAVRPVSDRRAHQTESLARLALRTEWELPDGFERVRFHTLGLKGSTEWLPGDNGELAVMSPFVTNTALRGLLGTTKRPVTLISRPEELEGIEPGLLDAFERVLILAEQAELEDGEEAPSSPDPLLPSYGLHAKAYVTKQGWDTHLYVGSANATNPALIHGTNVELVAELSGKRSKVGAVEDLVDGDGFGGLLVDYLPEKEPEPKDPAVEKARKVLEEARRALVGLGLRIRFEEAQEGWRAELVAREPLELDGVEEIHAWLVTRKRQTGTEASALRRGESVVLEPALIQHVTSFVAFELVAGAADERVSFVLSLEAEGLPVPERDAAVVRDVIRNRDGFLRYVMLLLAEAGEDGDMFGAGGGVWHSFNRGRPDSDLPLFEQLTRAFCRQPERLESIRRLMEEIGTDEEDDVVPQAFRELWQVFEAAVGAKTEVEE